MTTQNNDQPILPQGWVSALIEDIIGVGGVFVDGDWVESKDQDPQGDVRLIQLADIRDGYYRDKSERYLSYQKALDLNCTFLNENDVLVARMPDPLGRACLFPGDTRKSVTVVDVCIIRSGEPGINHRWLMYAINSPEFRSRIAELQSGSTRKRISRGNLSKLHLPLPPLAEHERIVAAMDEQFTRLDAGVAALKRAQVRLRRYRAAVLKAACEGQLVPQDPADEPAEALLRRILAERYTRWEESERAKGKLPLTANYKAPAAPDTTVLPKLPEGWVWTSLGQAFEVCVGATPSRKMSNYWGDDISWISSSEIQFNYIRNTKESITEIGLQNTSTKIHPIGTVLLGMIGEGRTRGQVAITSIPASNSQNSAAIRVSQTSVQSEFIFYYLWSQYEKTRAIGSGNNQPALNKSLVEKITFPLPPLAEQERMVAEIERRLSVVTALEATVAASLNRAERLRQSILKRAFAGQLVAQNPEDEPAEALLERIHAARAGQAKPAERGRRAARQEQLSLEFEQAE